MEPGTTYYQVVFSNTGDADTEILSACLLEVGFDSFYEEGGVFNAFIPAEFFDEDLVREALTAVPGAGDVEIRVIPVEDRNWNEIWESNFEPVIIDGKCLVRAPFHDPVEGIQYDLCIMPKMSFGTAHHETTSQVISLMLGMDLAGMRVLDMGSGTGVLAILAARMGATEVVAIDNDQWAYENAIENAAKNNTPGITVILGDAGMIPEGPFDLILANINRNILLEQIPAYAGKMKPGSRLILSGFYEEDLPAITECAAASGLRSLGHVSKNRWVAATYEA